MILKIIVIFILIIIIAVIANGVEDSHKDIVSISFKDYIGSTGVPIATFKHNNKELNFLLDTGGDYSYIDSTITDLLKPKRRREGSISVVTGGGSMASSGKLVLDLEYDGKKMEEEFIISDIRVGLDSAFGSVCTVHGVLGSSFFDKYDCNIDFKKYVTTFTHGGKKN